MHAASRYNFFVERADGTIAYNARTGIFAHISTEIANKLRGNDFSSLANETTIDLLAMGFLHEGDELSLVLDKLKPRELPQISFVLAPTIGCNRTCPYCFQNEYRSTSVMSEDVQHATIKFIESEIQSKQPKQVSCTWYGGEPLLEKDIVYRMTEEIERIVDFAGATMMRPELITNGDYFDSACQEKLAELGFSYIQISIDSLVDDGTSKRGIFTSDGNYSSLIRNAMTAMASKKFNVNIRINVTKRTSESLSEILAALKECSLESVSEINRAEDMDGEAGAVTLKTGSRIKATSAIIPIRELIDPNTLSRKQFADLKLNEKEKSANFLEFVQSELTPTFGSFCGATEGTMFVIDPEGNVSRCWNSAGVAAEAIGNVKDTEKLFGALETWNSYSPGGFESCASCRVLPLCKGGCSHPRLFADSKYPPCTDIKYNVDSYVSFVGSRLVISQD